MVASAPPGPSTAAADTLTSLYHDGQLVDEYPQVRRLLAGLSDPDLFTAGNLLARLDPDEIATAHPDTPILRILITGHGVIAPLVPTLTVELARHGMLARPRLAPFDNYTFDLAGEGQPRTPEPDVVLCVLDPQVVLDALPNPWDCTDLERAIEERIAPLERLVGMFRRTSQAPLVLNTLPLTRQLTGQILDRPSRARAGMLWREANIRLGRQT